MTASTPPVRLGIVGMARILPAHLRGLRVLRDHGLDRVRITALCARRIEDATTFRRPGEGPAPRPPVTTNERDPLGAPHVYVSELFPDTLPEIYDDWRKMLEDDAVDAVLVLAPVGIHHEVALDCLRAGKHVLIEKPFAISVRAGQAIVDEAKKRGLVIGVAENLRYAEGIRALGWVVNQGVIGDPQIWVSGGIGGDWSPDKIVARTPWRHQKLRGGGGGAIDIGVHLFHFIKYVMGPINEVSAFARTLEPERVERDDFGEVINRVKNEVEDVFLANLRFANGALGNVFWSWGGHGERVGLTADPAIYGTLGSVNGNQVVLDTGFRATTASVYTNQAPAELRRSQFPAGVTDSFALEMNDFLEAITSKRPMEASGEEGLLDLAAAFALLESATANRPVTVANVLTGKVSAYQDDINAHYRL